MIDPTWWTLGSATVYEASGRTGLVDIPLQRITPGARCVGRARTVTCRPNDNLGVHHAIDRAREGDVVVISSPAPQPIALVGEILALAAEVRGVAGLVVNGGVRDTDEITAAGFPVWARYVVSAGAGKVDRGIHDAPVELGSVNVVAGDLVVADADGVVVVSARREAEVLAASLQRRDAEEEIKIQLRDGMSTLDIYGLRDAFDPELEGSGL